MVGGSSTPELEPSSPMDCGLRKRVCKACDRCRLKKSKCDGATPCSRCKADNAICVFGERKKSHDKVYPKGYVELLEGQQLQLVSAVQVLYKMVLNGDSWPGTPLPSERNGLPLVHNILQGLRTLKPDEISQHDHFEEDFSTIQSRLFAQGAGTISRERSFDTFSDVEHSPVLEGFPPQKPIFTNPFTTKSPFPPTPPMGTPVYTNARTTSPLKTEFTAYDINDVSSMPDWTVDSSIFSNKVDGISTIIPTSTMFDPVVEVDNEGMDIDMKFFNPSFDTQFMPTSINPGLTMKNWNMTDEQMNYYLNQQIFSQ